MKSILAILFLFICEFGMGQVPGSPFFFKTGPIVYTFTPTSPTLDADKWDKANISGEIITRGQTIVQSGYIWGTTLPLTFATATNNVPLGAVSGQVTGYIHSLIAATTYYVAFYSSTASNTTIGNVIAYEHGVVTTTTGRTWMQWNLGATAFPSNNTTFSAMGSLYQWGRATDGHQNRTTPTSAQVQQINSSTAPKTYDAALVKTGKFLWGYSSWLNPQNDHLWQGVNGINNPCPSGYRVPTANEFMAEIEASSAYGPDPAFNSALKLQQGKRRDGSKNGTTTDIGGYYWTSSVRASMSDISDNPAYNILIFLENGNYPSTIIQESDRYHGMSVRCIKDYGIINSTHSETWFSALPTDRANVAAYDCPSSGAIGKILVGVDISNPDNPVSQTITANVTKVGTYAINAHHRGMIFSGSGTFTGTGSQTITLNVSGGKPPLSTLETYKFYLQSISPSCVFDRPTFYAESQGTAKITSFGLTTNNVNLSYPGGVMTVGVPVSGVTHNVTANVPQTSAATTYDLTTNTIRGVTFTANGTIAAGNARAVTIQLTASGTPTEVIDSTSNIYTLNPLHASFGLTTSPTNARQIHTFGRHIYETGTATFTLTLGTNIGTSMATMTAGTIITSGTTRARKYTANVTTTGTYNISATNNGVTFSRTGTFTNTGNTDIFLIPTGTPIASGTFAFTTNTTPSYSFNITFQ
jgi:uncharacterized protein (TIGR02145 family)